MNTFNEDLAFGKRYEYKLLQHIQYDSHQVIERKLKEYDVIVINKGKKIYYEVKADRIMHKTNNFCIEYRCSGLPSGISSTQADFYAYFKIYPNDGYVLYLIPVAEIKRQLKMKTYHTEKKGGDNFNCQLLLFKSNCFDSYKIIEVNVFQDKFLDEE